MCGETQFGAENPALSGEATMGLRNWVEKGTWARLMGVRTKYGEKLEKELGETTTPEGQDCP